MAGGIDWFRWHHGSVTDPKFQLIARKSGASLPDVLAVWAYLLESASAASDRGSFGEIDTEALDCLFNFPDTETRSADVMKAMEARGLIADGRIVAWEKRQPKREREDDTATDRKRRQREREAAEATHVTPCHATSRQETPREEEKREEPKPKTAPDGELFAGVAPQVVADFKAMRSKQRAAITKTAVDGIQREAMKAGIGLEDALRMCCERGWRGFKAEWIANQPARASPSSPQQLGKAGQETAAAAQRLREKLKGQQHGH